MQTQTGTVQAENRAVFCAFLLVFVAPHPHGQLPLLPLGLGSAGPVAREDPQQHERLQPEEGRPRLRSPLPAGRLRRGADQATQGGGSGPVPVERIHGTEALIGALRPGGRGSQLLLDPVGGGGSGGVGRGERRVAPHHPESGGPAAAGPAAAPEPETVLCSTPGRSSGRRRSVLHQVGF